MNYTVVTDQDVLDFLLTCSGHDRQAAAKVLYDLAANPHQDGFYQEPDAVGRTLQVKPMGRYVVRWWVDHYVKEVRVVQVKKLTRR